MASVLGTGRRALRRHRPPASRRLATAGRHRASPPGTGHRTGTAPPRRRHSARARAGTGRRAPAAGPGIPGRAGIIGRADSVQSTRPPRRTTGHRVTGRRTGVRRAGRAAGTAGPSGRHRSQLPLLPLCLFEGRAGRAGQPGFQAGQAIYSQPAGRPGNNFGHSGRYTGFSLSPGTIWLRASATSGTAATGPGRAGRHGTGSRHNTICRPPARLQPPGRHSRRPAARFGQRLSGRFIAQANNILFAPF